jgi:hypothetical protein
MKWLINKKAVKEFIKENSLYITQIESTFYTKLDEKVKEIILRAIKKNCSRRRITQYELF